MNTDPDPTTEPLPLPPGFVVIDPNAPPKKKKKPYKRKRRGRPKRVGRPRNDTRPSPAMREGRRFKTIVVEEIVYIHIQELKKFYKMPSLAKTVAKFIEPAFEKAYQDAVTLQKIAERKEKERAEIEARVAAYNTRKSGV